MVAELYGKCRELGYCDCKGFFGCVDPGAPTATGDDKRHGSIESLVHDRLRPYGKCTKCNKNLFSGRDHRCLSVDKPLFCQDCQADYTGKPSDHLREVHGRVIEEEKGWDKSPHALFTAKGGKERIMSAERIEGDPDCHFCMRWGKPCVRHGGTLVLPKPIAICGYCGKRKRSNHACKAQPTSAATPANAPDVNKTPQPVQEPAEDVNKPVEIVENPEPLRPSTPKPKTVMLEKSGEVELTITAGGMVITLKIKEVQP